MRNKSAKYSFLSLGWILVFFLYALSCLLVSYLSTSTIYQFVGVSIPCALVVIACFVFSLYTKLEDSQRLLDVQLTSLRSVSLESAAATEDDVESISSKSANYSKRESFHRKRTARQRVAAICCALFCVLFHFAVLS